MFEINVLWSCSIYFKTLWDDWKTIIETKNYITSLEISNLCCFVLSKSCKNVEVDKHIKIYTIELKTKRGLRALGVSAIGVCVLAISRPLEKKLSERALMWGRRVSKTG